MEQKAHQLEFQNYAEKCLEALKDYSMCKQWIIS